VALLAPRARLALGGRLRPRRRGGRGEEEGDAESVVEPASTVRAARTMLPLRGAVSSGAP
jgi:hypothetical protein